MSNRATRTSVLQDGDDPLGKCAAIGNEWRVTKKLSCGRLTSYADGGPVFEPYNCRAFMPGDFVDVCVGFDIVSLNTHRRNEPRFKIRPNLQHILHLISPDAHEEPVILVSSIAYSQLLHLTQWPFSLMPMSESPLRNRV